MSTFQTAFGRYELVEILGRGGFATVYRARDPLLRRDVALKTLLPHLCEDEGIRRRFMAEAQRIAQLHHPNIITVYEVGEVDGSPYFTMELIEGQTLASANTRGHQEELEHVVALMQDLCAAVDYLHRARLIHRDIKPANIMCENSGRIVLMDFGISRSLDESNFTQTGISIGTPKAMAPEQVQGKEVGPGADVYALGVLAYQFLSGRPPFEGEVSRILYAHAYEAPPDLRLLRPGLPEYVYDAIHAALAKDPENRPATAGLFAAALAGEAEVPVQPVPAIWAHGPADGDRTVAVDNAPTDFMPASVPSEAATPAAGSGSRVSRRALFAAGGAAAAALAAGGLLLARGGSRPKNRATSGGIPAATASPDVAVATALPTPEVTATPAALIVATPPGPPRVAFNSIVSTVAGSGQDGFLDGAAAEARFSYPSGLGRGTNGLLYVTDMYNNRIRTVALDGTVATLAGSGEAAARNGAALSAAFNQPNDVVVDAQGVIFVADSGNNQIRRIAPDGTVTTLAGSGERGFADGQGPTALFNYPAALTLDGTGILYVADFLNNRVRKVLPDGTVSTVAGSTRGYVDGLGRSAQFAEPGGLALDGAGNLFVSDSGNNRIRRISTDGKVTTVAGASDSGLVDGAGSTARFNSPAGLVIDSIGALYVADSDNNCIRRIGPDGYVSTLAGNLTAGFVDGPGSSARFSQPSAVTLDSSGILLVADSKNGRIRRCAINQVGT